MEISGRKMDAAWKHAISEGKKKGASALSHGGSLAAKGLLAVAPSNAKVRQRGLQVLGATVLGAAGIGSYGAAAGAASGAAIGALNKRSLVKQAVTSVQKSGVAKAIKAGTVKIGAKTYPVGAASGAKVLAKHLGTGYAVVGGIAGGVAGATDRRLALGKTMDKAIRKQANKH